MADSTVGLPPLSGPPGDKLDAEQLVVGTETVKRERIQIAGDGASDVAEVDAIFGLSVDVRRLPGSLDPQRAALLEPALPSGSSADLDSPDIAAGKTGRLAGVSLSSSAACRWVLKVVDGVVETTIDVVFTSGLAGGRPSDFWKPPDARYAEQAGGAGRRWRATVTNQDGRNAADAYATVYWDEE